MTPSTTRHAASSSKAAVPENQALGHTDGARSSIGSSAAQFTHRLAASSCQNAKSRYNQGDQYGGGSRLFGRSKKMQDSLSRTRQSFFSQITSLLGANEVTEETWEELEELLILADVGAGTTIEIVDKVRERVNQEHVLNAERVKEMLKEELLAKLDVQGPSIPGRVPLRVFLIVGVNGSGKTTSIAKLAYRHKELLDRKVMLAAADTFRAAAIDQIKLWGDRLGIEVISHQPGAGPGRGRLRCGAGSPEARCRRVDHRHRGATSHEVQSDARAEEGPQCGRHKHCREHLTKRCLCSMVPPGRMRCRRRSTSTKPLR